MSSAFPIPQTVSESEPLSTPKSAQMRGNILSPLDSDVAVKPRNLIQLACFFPEGQDKLGQQFSKQLRELGSSSIPALTIEPVLVSSWSSSTVDIGGWTKSAELSGADVMFILSSRQDAELFQSTSTGFQSTISTRVVALEHVLLRTLYNDILIELKRKV